VDILREILAMPWMGDSLVDVETMLDFMVLAIQGMKVGLDNNVEMVAALETEQLDEDHNKEFGAKQLDMAGDKTMVSSALLPFWRQPSRR